MRRVVVLLVGVAIGAVVMALFGRPNFRASQNRSPLIAPSSGQSYEEKYVACVIDEIQLAIMLHATSPEFVPEWLESEIARYAEELSGPLAVNALSTDALHMLEAYYTKIESQVPDDIKTMIEERRHEFSKALIKERLSELDDNITQRRLESAGKVELRPQEVRK